MSQRSALHSYDLFREKLDAKESLGATDFILMYKRRRFLVFGYPLLFFHLFLYFFPNLFDIMEPRVFCSKLTYLSAEVVHFNSIS